MIEYTTLALFVPADIVDEVRGLCGALAGEEATTGMFRTGVVESEDATEPTWFVTDGPIDAQFADLLFDPELMFTRCQEAGLSVSLEKCKRILSDCLISRGNGHAVMAERGWRLPFAPAL